MAKKAKIAPGWKLPSPLSRAQIRAFRRKIFVALLSTASIEELRATVDFRSRDLDDAVRGFPRFTKMLREVRHGAKRKQT